MNQVELWHDSIVDALGADISASGGIKKVSHALWPAMPGASAEAKLRACLNPDQPHKLDPHEVITIKRMALAAGSRATIDYEAAQLGYRIEIIATEDEAARLQRELVEQLKTVQRGLAMLEAVKNRAIQKVAT